ncbi:hypothetical protein ES703_118054 [subsurface metagenome]
MKNQSSRRVMSASSVAMKVRMGCGCSLRSLPFSRRRNELEMREVGSAPTSITSSGQSLTEGWCGSNASGFGTSRHASGCWYSASISALEFAAMPAVNAAMSAAVALAAKSRSHSGMLKVECLPPMKLATSTPHLRKDASGSNARGRRSASEAIAIRGTQPSCTPT